MNNFPKTIVSCIDLRELEYLFRGDEELWIIDHSDRLIAGVNSEYDMDWCRCDLVVEGFSPVTPSTGLVIVRATNFRP